MREVDCSPKEYVSGSSRASLGNKSYTSLLEHEFLHEHGDVQKTFFVEYTQDGPMKKILRYRLKALVQFGGVMSMFSKGTVFTMDWNVAKALLVTLVMALISAVLSSTVGIGDTVSVESLATQVNQFVPFVLGMYVSLALARWWALRVQALGKLFQALSDISMVMGTALPQHKWAPVHDQMVKLGLASIQLVSLAAKDEADLSILKQQELLSDEEVATLQKVPLFQRSVAVWTWICRLCEFALMEGAQPIPKIMLVQSKCCVAREGIQTIHTYLCTQLPFAYVHLLAWLVNVQNVVVAVKGGIVIEEAFRDGRWNKAIQEVVMILLVCLLYQGLLSISYVVQDPFGEDLGDFPISSYTQYVFASIRAMHKAQSECHPLDKVQQLLVQQGHEPTMRECMDAPKNATLEIPLEINPAEGKYVDL